MSLRQGEQFWCFGVLEFWCFVFWCFGVLVFWCFVFWYFGVLVFDEAASSKTWLPRVVRSVCSGLQVPENTWIPAERRIEQQVWP